MWTEEYLDRQLTIPSQRLIEDMKKIEGDILYAVVDLRALPQR